MEDDKSVKPKHLPSIPANYVTIVELQERWIKERQLIDKEKQDQERRMKQEEKNRPEKPKERGSNYVTIVDLRERRRKEKHENEQMMQKEEKKKRAEKQPRVRSERDSNYVTIVDLQERWIKERQRKEKEKQDQERLQKEIDSRKVEPAPGHRNRHFPPRNNRNAVSRREDLEGSGKPKPRAEGEVTVEGGSRVGRKSDDGDLGQEGAPEIEENFENLSLKGVNRETSASANGPRIQGTRNEERCHGTKPRRNGGNWNVGISGDADKVLVCDQSGSNPSINPGNRMQRSVKIDRKLERVPVGNASGRSNPNITKSSEIKGGNWNVDVNVNADKVLVCDQSGSNPIVNSGNKTRRNVKIDGKLEKVPVGNASGRSNTNITEGSEMDRKLMKAVTSGTREGSTSSNMMDGAVGIDGNFEIVSTVGSNTSNGGNRVDKNFHTEGKCEKVRIIARGRGYSRVETNGFKRGVCLDRPEMVWVKKGEVFAGNAGRIQNSGRYSVGSK